MLLCILDTNNELATSDYNENLILCDDNNSVSADDECNENWNLCDNDILL